MIKKIFLLVAILLSLVATGDTAQAGMGQTYGYCPPPSDNHLCVFVSTNLNGGIATFTINSRIADETAPGIPSVCPAVTFSVSGATSWEREGGCNDSNSSSGSGNSTQLLAGAGYLKADTGIFSVPYGGNPTEVCQTISWSRAGMTGPNGVDSGSFDVCATPDNGALPIGLTDDCYAATGIPPSAPLITVSFPTDSNGITVYRNGSIIATGVTNGSYVDNNPGTGMKQYTVTDSLGNSGTDTIDVGCSAIITVTEVNRTGGTWVIMPENKTGTANVVHPLSGGSQYMLNMTSAPANCSYVITNTDSGGLTLTMYPNTVKGFTITYTCTGGGESPLVDLDADGSDGPITKSSGQSATLSWTVTGNPDTCTASSTPFNSNWDGSKSTVSGSSQSSGGLTNSTRFSILCSNSAGDGYDDVIVNITGTVLPPTVDLKANGFDSGVTVSSGDSVTLSWTTNDSPTSCNASSTPATTSWNGSKSTSGSSQSSDLLTIPTRFNILCSNSGGTAYDYVIVDVGAMAQVPTVDLTANGSQGPITVGLGASATLQWTTTGSPDTCTASNAWTGSKNPSGSTESTGALSPLNSQKVYTIYCENTAGSDTDQVIVNVGSVSPPDADISVTDNEVSPNGTTRIDWGGIGADDCEASASPANANWQGYLDPSGGGGSVTSSPISQATTFTLTCTNAYGTDTDTETVTVTPGVVCAAPATGAFTGCYYDTMSLTDIKVSRTDAYPLNFDWGNGSPDSSIGVDTYSAEWNGNFTFTNQTYRFTATGDDGIRVYVDGVLAIDRWIDQGPTTYTADVPMSAGSHLIRMEFYENGGGAVAALSWAPLSGSVITVDSNQASSWTITGANPVNGTGLTTAHAVTPGAGGTIYSLSSIADIPGYTYAVTNSQGGGSSMTLFSGSNASFTITYNTSASTFDYSLSNNGNVAITKSSGTTQGQSQVTASLVTGPTQAVNFTATGMPAGVSVAYANQGCSPTCAATITFSVQSSVAAGTYPITVTSTSAGVADKTTSFDLVVNNPAGLSVTCTPTPSPAYIGQPVTWTANASGGISPYTYAWSGTNFPGTPTSNPYSFTYQTTGPKTASVTVTDSDGATASCAGSTVQVGIDPRYQEF